MRIAELLEIPAHNVGVKAKTGEGVDAVRPQRSDCGAVHSTA